jgi:microcystin-dependent protein
VNANPLSGGFVYMYVPPNTTTLKTTWQDAGETIPNSNPIILDGNGSCLLYGSGQYLQYVYDSQMNLVYSGLTQDLYELVVTSPALITVPVGGLVAFAGTTAPTNWLLCYGQSLSTTTFSQLFGIIGYIYGGSGLNFNIPDMRGRLAAGVDNMGGSAANRITSGNSGITGTTLGASGGTELLYNHMHTTSVVDPGHAHTISPNAFTNQTNSLGAGSGGGSAVISPTSQTTSTVTTGITVTVAAAGTGNSQNVQPSLMLNYIIFAGTS